MSHAKISLFSVRLVTAVSVVAWLVVLLVFSCCVYATTASFSRLYRLRRIGALRADTVRQRVDVSSDELVNLGVPAEFQDALQAAFSSDPRRARAGCNEVLLEVQGVLDEGAGLDKGAWRICLASGGAGLLLVVWSEPIAAGLIAVIGLCATLSCVWIGRSAEHWRRRVRTTWNTLIRGRSQSFTSNRSG